MVVTNSGRRIISQSLKDLLNLCKSFNPFEFDRFHCVFVVAVFLIESNHSIPQRHIFSLVVSRCLAESNRCGDGILVSCVCTDQTTVGLFHSEQIRSFSGLLIFQDLLSDVFESRQNLYQFTVIGCCDRIYQIGGYDRFNNLSICRDLACSLLLAQHIVAEQRT